MEWGFSNSRADSLVFFFSSPSLVVIALKYVDDILITGDCSDFISKFISRLNDVFALKDIAALSYYLGMEVHKTVDGMFLFQTFFTELV